MKLSLYFAATLASLLTTSTALPFDASSYNLDARDLGDFEFHDLAARDFDYEELGARDFDDLDVRDFSELEVRVTPKAPAKPAAKPKAASTPAKGKKVCTKKGKKQRRTTPPSAKSKIPALFHGTKTDQVADLRKGIKVDNMPGDFHPSGAFYLTDRMETAAQFACHSGGSAKTVAVFEYSWDPAGHSVYEFPSQTTLWKDYTRKNIDDRNHVCAGWDAIIKNDMITGPMRGAIDIENKLTSNFWQYAATAKGISGLKLTKVHENVDCSNHPQGDC